MQLIFNSEMDGKPFKVGRFAHSLRVRLMREHLGVDVDAMYEEDLMAGKPVKPETEIEAWDPDHEQQSTKSVEVTRVGGSRHEKGVGSMATDLKEGAMQGMT